MSVKSDGCGFGKVTRSKLEGMKELVEKIEKNVTKLTNHYSQRSPWWITFVIAGLCSLCTALIASR